MDSSIASTVYTVTTLNSDFTPENCPEELRARRQWVCWKWHYRDGKWTKIPVNPHTGKPAKTNDSRTWSTFEHAVATWKANPKSIAGVGYVFTDDPYVGKDFDDCIEDGKLDPWVAERLCGYAEVSPSGKGVKVIVRAKLPTGKRSRYAEGRRVELYSERRFFTITGWTLAGHYVVTDEQEAVDRLHEELAPKPSDKESRRGGTATSVEGPPIPEGERHKTIRSILGRAHDSSKTLADLIATAEKVNAERCEPPIGSPGDEDPVSDLEDMARWVYDKEPCSPSRPPELDAMCERLGQLWYEVERRGLGGKGAVRLYRYLIREAQTIGTVYEGEGVGVARSLREAEEELGCHRNTVFNAKNRLVDAGLIRYDKSSCRDRGNATFVLLTAEARQNCDATPHARAIDDGVTKTSRPGADELETLHYAHRGPVGYSREDTLCFVEAHPGHTREELAELFGWTRPRDLERMHLRYLEELALLEERDGRWFVGDAYEERQRDVRETAYSTIQQRSARKWSLRERRWIHYVAESGCVASQSARQEQTRERNRKDREKFRRRLAERRQAAEDECFNGAGAPDGPAFEELPQVGHGHRPEGEGWRLRYERGYWSWVNFDTGEMKEIA